MTEEYNMKIDRQVSKMADEFAEREYETDGYERLWLSKGYYHGYMDANKDKIEEPVSSIWHDSNKQQPEEGSTVAIWNGENGEILARCVNVYPDRLWAYMDDLLHKQEEPVSEDFEQALEAEWKGYVDRGAATVDALEDNTQELAFAKGFYKGAQWQKEQTISKAVEWLQRNIDSRDWLMDFRKMLEE